MYFVFNPSLRVEFTEKLGYLLVNSWGSLTLFSLDFLYFPNFVPQIILSPVIKLNRYVVTS